jgi:hypothetical protein
LYLNLMGRMPILHRQEVQRDQPTPMQYRPFISKTKKAKNGLHSQLKIQTGVCDSELCHKKALQF